MITKRQHNKTDKAIKDKAAFVLRMSKQVRKKSQNFKEIYGMLYFKIVLKMKLII